VAGSQAFSSTSAFNANIGGWNTASVKDMSLVCALRPLRAMRRANVVLTRQWPGASSPRRKCV
jgi:surface protein